MPDFSTILSMFTAIDIRIFVSGFVIDGSMITKSSLNLLIDI